MFGNYFGPGYFGDGYFGAGGGVAVQESLGAGNWAKLLTGRKKRRRVIRWSDYADEEERREALAQALAAASIPLSELRDADGSIDEDAMIEEEDAIITALVLSRLIH